jgi:hypothetical protein
MNVRNSIKNSNEFPVSWAVGIQNVLPKNVLDKLNTYYDTTDQWKPEPQGEIHTMDGNDCGGSFTIPRRSLIWAEDTVLEEMYQSFDMLADTIGTMWNKKLEIHSVNFWEDQPGFVLPHHIDPYFISAAIQIYINDNDESAGTELFNENKELLHKVPWVKNSGYVLNSIPTSWHGVTTPSMQKRRSVYAIYKDA